MNKKFGFGEIIRDQKFRKLFFAGIISRFGDSVDAIAYAYMVYALTGSAALMAILFAVNGIPSLVLNMFSGVLVSYMPKKKVVYLMDIMRGLLVSLTAVLFVTNHLEVWHLYLFTILNSTCEAFRAPAAATLFKMLIEDSKLEAAASLNNSARTFAELIGFSVAAFLIGIVGVSGAILVDGVTFFLSGLLVLSIKMEKEVLRKQRLTLKVYGQDFKEGLQYVWKNPLIRSLTFFAGGLMFFFSPFNALQTPFVLDIMKLGPDGISIMSISFMVAMMLGSLLVPILSKKVGYRVMFIGGGVIIGIGYLLFGIIHVFQGTIQGYGALAIVSLIMGSSISFMNVPISVSLMRQVEQEKFPRVISVVNVLGLSAVPLGGAIVGALVKWIPIPRLFFFSGVAITILFLSQRWNKAMKNLGEKVEVEQVNLQEVVES